MEIFNRKENDPWHNAPAWALDLRRMVGKMMERLMVDFTKLNADITAQTTVLAGAVSLIQGLNAATTAAAPAA
jgi:hypothetical protein